MENLVVKHKSGESYKITLPRGNVSEQSLTPETFWNESSAQQFVNNLVVSQGIWRDIIHQCDSFSTSCMSHDNIEKQVSSLMMNDKIKFYPVKIMDTVEHPPEKRVLKSDNTIYRFEPSSSLLFMKSSETQNFKSIDDAYTFLNKISNSEAELAAIAKELNIDIPKTAYINEGAITDIISEELISGNIVVIVDKISSTPPTKKEALNKSDIGNKNAGLGPHETENIIFDISTSIKLEYKVVIYDKGLSRFQKNNEKPIQADPAFVQLSLISTGAPYDKGAQLTCTPKNVEFYEDKELKKSFDIDKIIGKEKIANGAALKLYLKSKNKGKFKLKLTPEKSSDSRFNVVKIANEELSCVELKFHLHQHDITQLNSLKINPDTDTKNEYYDELKNLNLPEQILVSDEDKISKSRLLHLQSDNNFSRAKVTIPKIDASEWPSGCEDYDIIINKQSGSLSGDFEFFDQEVHGSRIDLPFKVKQKDLVKGEKTIWIQGSRTTNNACDLKLNMGLDRPSGGVIKSLKNNADWCNFTVVKINEVRLDYTPIKGKPSAWKEAEEKFYINLAGDSHQNKIDGRKIKIKVSLSEKINNIPVHFMLVEDKYNRTEKNWGQDLPSTWKWKEVSSDYKHLDKKKRENFVHLSALTDENGVATCEVTLSRFGGDVFIPAAYIEQDPHLAKYIEGQDELKDKKPILSTKKINVWRKFWYQITQPSGFAAPMPTLSESAYNFVKTDMVLDNIVEFDETNVPTNTFYKKYMIEGGSDESPVAVIGSHNKDILKNKFVSNMETPLKNHLIVCSHQYDEGNKTDRKKISLTSPSANNKIKLHMDVPVFDPPLQGGDMVISAYYKQGADPTKHAIENSNISIPKPRLSNDEVEIKLPVSLVPSNANPIHIYLKCQAADGPYLGESFGINSLIVYDGKDVDDYNDTITHEIGHAFNQTPSTGEQPSTIPVHPNWFSGAGTHCNNDNKKCVMYESGPQYTAIHKYCEICHPYLLVEDMSKFRT